MGNLLQYADKSKTIDARLDSMLSAVERAYKNGQIRTEAEYYYRVKESVNKLYESLTKPSFKFRPAVSTPMSDEYNSMVEEACNDMAYIIGDCEALEEFVSRSFSDAELSRNMMTTKLNELTKRVDSLLSSASSGGGSGYATFAELFTDESNMANAIDAYSLVVDSSNSMLRLRQETMTTVNIDEAEIDPNESNGLPGNTHCASSLNGDLYFDGQDGSHNRIGFMFDGSDDTWFEYEIFSITDSTRIECGSYGFEYDEGVSWITNEPVLRLKLIVYFKDNDSCSWVTLKPFVPEIKGVKPCYIETCDVISATNTAYRVAENIAFDDLICCTFPAQKIQRMEVTFIQPSKYLTNVGHFYYASANTMSSPLFEEQGDVETYARVDGKKPSVGLLGCTYDPTTRWIKYQKYTDMFDIPISETRNNAAKLFVPGETTLDKKAGQELIKAYRYMLGVRYINAYSCVFTDYGRYVSRTFRTEDEITSITLEADEYIPGDDSECIQYFISMNKGLTWHKIYPVHRAYCGIYRYYVNNDTISNLINNKDEKRSQNLSVVGRADSIKIKIEMFREKNNIYSTPIVHNYRLRLTVGGETIEY